MRSLALTSLTRSDFERTQRFGERLLDRGEREDDPVLIVEGAYLLGVSAFWQAEFSEARRRFEQVEASYRPEHRGIHLLRYSQDTRVVCVSRLANAQWFLGAPDEAVRTRDRALALAREAGHPFTTGITLWFAGLLAVDMDDQASLQRCAARLAGLVHGTRPLRAGGAALAGYVDVLDGRIQRGLARCRQVIADEGDAPAAPGLSAALQRVLLAACLAAGDAGAALAAADRLLQMGGAACVWQPEARRRRDELLAAGRNT
jgi:hypothetical protein